jgi:hypothetical protein
MEEDEHKLHTVIQAAQKLNVSAVALYGKLRRKEIDGGYRFGRKVLVNVTEALASMRDHR